MREKIRFALEEAQFIRSFRDLRIYFQKAAYVWRRSCGIHFIHRRTPPSIQIEPTNYCNANCICCSAPRSKRPRGYMDYALFRKIVDEAAAIRVRRIHLYLHGEPMLHPSIIEMIAYTKSHHIGIHFTTNGMLVGEEAARAILASDVDSGDHFRFSILGHTRQVHEAVMRGVQHDIVVQNIHRFLEMRKRRRFSGPVVEVIMYSMPENEREQAEFLQYWTGKVDHTTVVGRVSRFFSEYKRGKNAGYHRRRTCIHIWERLTVLWNGDVTVCCMDIDGDCVVGSLGEDSISRIWNGERLSSIRKIHKEGKLEDFPFCEHCDF